MLLLVAMCLSLMGGSAYAIEFGSGSAANNNNVEQQNPSSGSGFELGSQPVETPATTATPNSNDQSLVTDGTVDKATNNFQLFSALETEKAVKGGSGSKYDTVEAAVEANETSITVEKGVTETSGFTISSTVSINVNSGVVWAVGGNTLNISGAVSITGDGTFTYTTPINVNGTLNMTVAKVANSNSAGFNGAGSVTINGGTYNIGSGFFGGNAKLTVNRGTFNGATPPSTVIGGDSVLNGDNTVTDNKTVATYNGQGYKTIQLAINAVPSGGVGTITVSSIEDALPSESITVSDNKNITLNMGGQEINSSITVSNATLTLSNGGARNGNITVNNGGKVVATGSAPVNFSSVTVQEGGSFTSNGSGVDIGTVNSLGALNISAGIFDEVNSNGTGSITGGTFTAFTSSDFDCVSGGTFGVDPSNYLLSGYAARKSGTQWIVEPASSSSNVVQSNGGSYYQYYIDPTAGTSNTLKYISTTAASSITLQEVNGNNISLTQGSDYTYLNNSGKHEYTLNLGNLLNNGTLRATKYIVSFAFADGVDANQYIYTLPKVLASNMSYKDGNTQMPTFTLTNAAPNGYAYGAKKLAMVQGVDYTVSADGKTVTLTKDFFTKKTGSGNFTIYFMYQDGSSYPMGTVSVNTSSNPDDGSIINPGNASVWPANENTWYSGNGMFYFYVQPSLLLIDAGSYKYYEVAVDGALVGGNKISYSAGSQRFGIASSYMDNLAPGSHTMSVRTANGYASCTFYVGATLRPVDTDKHVIGSSKTLSFVCSEPISSVYVGGTQLVNYYDDYYTLSNSRRTITLSAAFLNARTAGSTYTLSVVTDSGSQPSCTFQILTKAQASASPQTGDESNLALWAAVLLLSGGAMVAVMPRLKKGKNK